MSKISELEMTIKELQNVAILVNEIASSLTEMFHTADSEEEPRETPTQTLSLEEVRAYLAEKSRLGFTAEIRNLLQKYGATKLSSIDPAHYQALLADAEVLGSDE